MEKIVINCEKRDLNENVSLLRKNRIIPWIVYWHKQENIAIKVNNLYLTRAYKKAGKNHVLTLSIDWKDVDVLIHDVQFDPVRWDFLHVDFYAISKWEKITTTIPLVFVWVSKAKTEWWAIIEELIKEVKVKCFPSDLIDNFEVDLSKLEKIWDNIKISDIDISSKFEVLNSLDDVVAIASDIKSKEESLENNEEASEGESSNS